MSFELDSHVSDHGRVYQQGRGGQYNIDRAYFEPQGAHSTLIFSVAPGTLVHESDPLDLGVHRAAMLDGNAVPAYVSRDVDDELTEKLTLLVQRGGLLVIVGDSTAGKSRTAYQVLLKTAPNHRIISPYDRAELRDAFAIIAVLPDPVVLWLDNIEKYLGNDGLTPRITSYLKRRGVICLGTIRAKEYRGLTDLSVISAGIDSRRHEELISSEHVLEQAELVFMQRRWTAAETARARKVSDIRVAEALTHSDTYGFAEYLAAGPKLYEEWSLASAVDANPRGAALVSAAIDCQRAGMLDSVPLEVLQSAHEFYLESAGGQLLRPETFEDALAWSTRLRYGITSLLLPGKQPRSYRAFDYLIDKTITSEDTPPVPDIIWESAKSFFSSDFNQLREIALAAALQENFDIAIPMLTDLAAKEMRIAARDLGDIFYRQLNYDLAEHWYKRAIDLGSIIAATRLGHVFQFNDRIAEAEPWYEYAAKNGDPHGMYHMGLICQGKGMAQDAEKWFRDAVEHEETMASKGLGELLVSSGRLEEAQTLLRAASDKGDLSAMVYLGIVLDDLKQTKEAERLWRRAAAAGSGGTKANLARLSAKAKRYSEAEKLFREAKALGVPDIEGSLSIVVAHRGRWSEAERLASIAFKQGNVATARYLGNQFWAAWNMPKAEEWLKKAVDAGESKAIGPLATVLEAMGRRHAAEPYWQMLADEGDEDATFALAKDSARFK